uniref:Ubiquitin carboxyl-terminal hydrolase n=1 Tax=Oryzias sinensis TaxID=183150 RepID=A0A8C7Y4H8_9TELE
MSAGPASSSDPKIRYHGLKNHGATCYLNSVLQVLFMTEDFREAVNSQSKDEFIDHHLKDLFDHLVKGNSDAFDLIKALDIDTVNEQRDAAEYCQKILRLTSPHVAKIFHGELTNRRICLSCKTETDTDEPFWILPLSLVDSCSELYSVDDGISEFFKTSFFTGEDQMYCEHCDTKVDACTKYVVKHHPEVLILLLKRFDFNYKYMTYMKINSAVDVPTFLEIPENKAYELYAVVDHFGDLRGGHYCSRIRSQVDSRWYEFNDTWVTQIDNNVDSDIKRSNTAFLLFYRKKDTKTEQGTSLHKDDGPIFIDNHALVAEGLIVASATRVGLPGQRPGGASTVTTGSTAGLSQTMSPASSSMGTTASDAASGPALLEPDQVALLPGDAALAVVPRASAVPTMRGKRHRMLHNPVAQYSGKLSRSSHTTLSSSPSSGNPTSKQDNHFGLMPARKHVSGAPVSPHEPAGAEAAAACHPAAVRGRPARRPGPALQPVLIVGDTIVQHVRVFRCRTMSLSGAVVNYISNSARRLTVKHPSAKIFIVHAGSYNLKQQKSETLKMDFINLIHKIQLLNINCIISGPLPAPCYGDIMFSRVLQLHIWLKAYCHSMSILYIDNFTTFYNRPYLLKADGLHPNNSGSRLLSMNIDLTLRSFKTISN